MAKLRPRSSRIRSVYVSPSSYDRIYALAWRLGCPIGGVIEEALDTYLDRFAAEAGSALAAWTAAGRPRRYAYADTSRRSVK